MILLRTENEVAEYYLLLQIYDMLETYLQGEQWGAMPAQELFAVYSEIQLLRSKNDAKRNG